MPRFVILEHDHPALHWDLMLETAGMLRTWRLAAPPHAEPSVAAEAIGDHRLAYLDYEGSVSGNRGFVKAWDRGTYVLENDASEHGRLLIVQLEGIRFRGRVTLQRAADGNWVMTVTGGGERET